MERKFIRLKESGGYTPTNSELEDVKEGDVVDGYEVEDVWTEECSHPRYLWNITRRKTKHEPEVTGECSVCGQEFVLQVEGVKEV